MMRERLKKIWGNALLVLQNYPMVLACALIGSVAAAVGIRMTEGINSDSFEVTKLAFTGCLGISLMFAIKMLSERIGKRFLLEIIGVALLAAFYFILPNHEKNFTEVYAFVLIPVFILSHLFVAFSSFINRISELKFWQYNKNLLINLVLTGIFTGVLVGGVLLAILAVDKLFDFNFDGAIYPQTFFFIAIIGSAFIFLLFSERGLETLENDGSYPKILKFFTQFVLIPLLLIYAVILYIYSAKILINWELPRGWVSYLILAYSVVGILALLLVHPLKGESSKSWVKMFSKIFYFTLLPLLVLLFTAIFTRILEYGYTEARYFVLLLALWLTTVVFYFILIKTDNIKFIPISLFVFGAFALIFPFLNAFSTAKRSQKHELIEVLNENKLLEGGKINFHKKVNDTIAEEIADKFGFLAERKEQDFLLKFIPNNPELKKSINQNNGYNIKGAVRSEFKNVIPTEKKITTDGMQMVSSQRVLPIADYDFAVTIYPHEQATIPATNEVLAMRSTSQNEYKIELESATKTTQSYDLMPFMKAMVEQNKNRQGRIEVPEISHEFDLGGYKMKAYIREIDVYGNNSNQTAVPLDMVLLIKKK